MKYKNEIKSMWNKLAPSRKVSLSFRWPCSYFVHFSHIIYVRSLYLDSTEKKKRSMHTHNKLTFIQCEMKGRARVRARIKLNVHINRTQTHWSLIRCKRIRKQTFWNRGYLQKEMETYKDGSQKKKIKQAPFFYKRKQDFFSCCRKTFFSL